MIDSKLFIRRIGLIGFVNIVLALKGLILLSILTKSVSTADYGTWSLSMVTIQLVALLALLGLNNSMTRFLPSEKCVKKVSSYFFATLTIIAISSIVIGSIFYLSSGYIATLLTHNIEKTPIFQFVSIIIIIWTIDLLLKNLFRSRNQMKKYSFVTIFTAIGDICIIYFAVTHGYGIIGALMALMLVRILTILISIYIIKSDIGYEIPDFSIIKEYLYFGIPMIPAAIFGWIINAGDRYVIGYILGSESIGIYSAAYAIGSVPSMFIGALGIVLYPTISKEWDTDRLKAEKTIKNSLKYIFIFGIPIVFLMSLLSKYILITLTSADYLSGYLVIPIVAISSLVYGIYTVYMYKLAMHKRTKSIALTLGIASILNIILNVYMIPKYDIAGAAIATLVSFVLLVIITIKLTKN